ncbi:hypothetical protein HY546_01615 [archaeon]|nr:hypothetical protein [archaeon]
MTGSLPPKKQRELQKLRDELRRKGSFIVLAALEEALPVSRRRIRRAWRKGVCTSAALAGRRGK